jgi:hypothetical protein
LLDDERTDFADALGSAREDRCLRVLRFHGPNFT